MAHPRAYRGQSFTFAAEIVAVMATSEVSYIEVELLRLDRRGRPRRPPRPAGRAFLRRAGRIDASHYLPGHVVLGSVRFTDVTTGVVAGVRRPYPLLDLLDHRVVRPPPRRGRPRFHLGIQGGMGL